MQQLLSPILAVFIKVKILILSIIVLVKRTRDLESRFPNFIIIMGVGNRVEWVAAIKLS